MRWLGVVADLPAFDDPARFVKVIEQALFKSDIAQAIFEFLDQAILLLEIWICIGLTALKRSVNLICCSIRSW